MTKARAPCHMIELLHTGKDGQAYTACIVHVQCVHTAGQATSDSYVPSRTPVARRRLELSAGVEGRGLEDPQTHRCSSPSGCGRDW